jgi:hypothetical protein
MRSAHVATGGQLASSRPNRAQRALTRLSTSLKPGPSSKLRQVVVADDVITSPA